jgi:hypothetical protein
MRFAGPIAIALAAALLAGCGSSGGGSTSTGSATTPSAPAGASATACDSGTSGAEALRAVAVSCPQARRLALGWQHQAACSPSGGASRSSCATGSYRCLGVATSLGIAVTCARPGHTVAFIAKSATGPGRNPS